MSPPTIRSGYAVSTLLSPEVEIAAIMSARREASSEPVATDDTLGSGAAAGALGQSLAQQPLEAPNRERKSFATGTRVAIAAA